MVAIISLFIVLVMSLLVTRIAAMALMLTGLSRETAVFQARSAFTGVGYTTTESEEIVSHPVRRRIVLILMLLGNLGVGAVIVLVKGFDRHIDVVLAARNSFCNSRTDQNDRRCHAFGLSVDLCPCYFLPIQRLRQK